jgi:hypothetical protein
MKYVLASGQDDLPRAGGMASVGRGSARAADYALSLARTPLLPRSPNRNRPRTRPRPRALDLLLPEKSRPYPLRITDRVRVRSRLPERGWIEESATKGPQAYLSEQSSSSSAFGWLTVVPKSRAVPRLGRSLALPFLVLPPIL